MPIAKLSRKFYETFGDDLTTELVNYLNAVEAGYRSELRDLFEAHFGRFDAKLEQRSADIRRELHDEIAGLDGMFQQRIAGLEAKLEVGIAGLEAKLEQRIAEVRREIAELRGELRAEFHKDIGSVKADLIKWNFAFWVPVALGLIGLYFKG